MSKITPEMLEELIPKVSEMTRTDLEMMCRREKQRRIEHPPTMGEELPPLDMWEEILDDMRWRGADFLGELGDKYVARMIGYDLPDD